MVNLIKLEIYESANNIRQKLRQHIDIYSI